MEVYMARPSRSRKICTIPRYKVFGAISDVNSTETVEKTGNAGTAATDEKDTVTLNLDEYEAIRMIDYLGRTHEQCAIHMGISRTTVTEIYERARFKVSDMLINGKTLHIDGGSISVCAVSSECMGACAGSTKQKAACGGVDTDKR